MPNPRVLVFSSVTLAIVLDMTGLKAPAPSDITIIAMKKPQKDVIRLDARYPAPRSRNAAIRVRLYPNLSAIAPQNIGRP